ncbi:hypothetical protein WMY93_007514 [Mugilogobius chulae]|uniref:Uncharacterized protein n=1 Tax=Mugilogobius chulae TaxID=88201 RepID=A0AAW0PD72_9GOBI
MRATNFSWWRRSGQGGFGIQSSLGVASSVATHRCASPPEPISSHRSTLMVYLAAISCWHCEVNGTTVGHDRNISLFLTGARRLNPPRRPMSPSWDLSLVLEVLQSPPFEPVSQVSYKWLSWKTAFLLAMASGSRKSSALSTQHLARWVVEVIKHAYVSQNRPVPAGVRCHSSWAAMHGVPLEVICAAASWSSPSTSARFYRVNLIPAHPLDGILHQHRSLTP